VVDLIPVAVFRSATIVQVRFAMILRARSWGRCSAPTSCFAVRSQSRQDDRLRMDVLQLRSDRMYRR
jgi:hypothetical protein